MYKITLTTSCRAPRRSGGVRPSSQRVELQPPSLSFTLLALLTMSIYFEFVPFDVLFLSMGPKLTAGAGVIGTSSVKRFFQRARVARIKEQGRHTALLRFAESK